MDRGRNSRRGGRWRHSLYARAALFLLLGSGSLLGAVVVWSSTIVDESVDRLLDERLDLARTVGLFLEYQVRADVERLSTPVSRALSAPSPSADALREALAGEYRATLFEEGAFVLSPAGELIAAVPDAPTAALRAVDGEALRRRAEVRRAAVSSPLVSAGNVPVLVVLAPLFGRDGEIEAFLGGLIQPSATNLLGPMAHREREAALRLELVDQRGIVVSSTNAQGLYRPSDHGNVLASAISQNRPLEGRCHTCHEPDEGPGVLTTTDVMAFAPLPGLDLGLAVHQPEDEALAPAFALRERLMLIGLAFVALFVMFAGLSVRSVVRPVTRLTDAVHTAEAGAGAGTLTLGTFGRDEVGELADALEFYHSRMLESLADAERSREALHHETEATRHHLETLQEIAAESTTGRNLSALAEHALDRVLRLHGDSVGTLRVRYQNRRAEARRRLMADEAEQLLKRANLLLEDPDPSRPRAGASFGATVIPSEASTPASPEPDVSVTGPHRIGVVDDQEVGGSKRSFIVAALETTQGLLVLAAIGTDDAPERAERDRLVSLLHHVGMSATNLLLRELDNERRRLQRWYLQRVLRAQEDERRRIARELHDTLAQDLAALRLEIERLSAHPDHQRTGARLVELERRAHDMLIMVRQILLDLRLSALDNMGFVSALQAHAERVMRDSGVRVMFAIDGEEREPGYDVAVTLFRIIQESLANAVQHGDPEHIMLTVNFTPGYIELTVEDDGSGFDLQSVRQLGAQEGRGLGLVGMEERARLLGGELTISASPDEGTTIRVSVPLGPRGEARGPAELPEEPLADPPPRSLDGGQRRLEKPS